MFWVDTMPTGCFRMEMLNENILDMPLIVVGLWRSAQMHSTFVSAAQAAGAIPYKHLSLSRP